MEGAVNISWQVRKTWLVRQDLCCWWSRWNRWPVMMDFSVKGVEAFGSYTLLVYYPWKQCWPWRQGKFLMVGLQDMWWDHKRWEIDFCLQSLMHSFQLATLVKAISILMSLAGQNLVHRCSTGALVFNWWDAFRCRSQMDFRKSHLWPFSQWVYLNVCL